jgi:AcrR family transcriptional regulator
VLDPLHIPPGHDLAGPAPDPPGTTYPRGRTPRAVREAQMVAAAERLFSERGYHGVSMDEIAAASGISKPMLYDYFGSKEGLLLACVERARGRLFEEIAVAVRAADEPGRALRAGIEAFLTFADQQRATWVVLFGEGGRFGETAGAIRAEQSGLIAQLLRELPGWTGEPDAEQLDAVAHVFVGAAEAIAFWAVAHPEIPLERVADHLMAVLWPVVRELPSRAASGAAAAAASPTRPSSDSAGRPPRARGSRGGSSAAHGA